MIPRPDPFEIEGPATISFSGGRTSAYMLRRILDAGLQPNVHVVFADTGKEREETYDFVRECSRRWRVNVIWVRRLGHFDKLIEDKQALPNTVQRFCTQELKLKPMWAFARGIGWEHWDCAIGIRADEPRRVAKILGRKPDERGQHNLLPLASAGVTEADVLAFWASQPFDLRLQPWEGNCDLCFLKAQNKRVRIMQDRPDLAEWWIGQERKTGRTFRAAPRPSYPNCRCSLIPTRT
jgi:Phosphoadenosine phosphosulfate reductase family